MPKTIVGKCFGLRLATSLLALGILSSACTPIKSVRGYVPEPNLVQAVRAGVDNKSSVQAMLGSPSVVGTFDDNNWYYISKRTEKVAFFDDRITEQNIMAIHFDDKGYVTAINNLGLEDAKQINVAGNLDFSSRYSATLGASTMLAQPLRANSYFRSIHKKARAGKTDAGLFVVMAGLPVRQNSEQ